MGENRIAAFNFDREEIRIIMIGGEPWFIARDVAICLGYKKPLDAVLYHCKGVQEIRIPTAGGEQTVNIIPESDVYLLVMRSNAPHAERFQKWVCGEVLPSIRKTGGYGSDLAINQAADMITRGLMPIVERIVDGQTRLQGEMQRGFLEVNDRLSKLERRQQLTPATRRRHRRAELAMYDGKCPCCQLVTVIDKNGEEIPGVAEADHWRLPSQPDVDKTWIVCKQCNRDLKQEEVHQQREPKFAAYQQARRDYERECDLENRPLLQGIE